MTVRLNDGHAIPAIGLGTWPMNDDEVETAILTAVEVGYRHIDTAVKYGNERGVGRGVARSGIARDEIFVTTKLDGTYQGEDRAEAGLADSLDRLGFDYVDLLLIHWPLPQRDQFVSTWNTFEKLQEKGLARSIGVSNFTPTHLTKLMSSSRVVPAVNQIQVSPAITRRNQRAFNSANDIVTESWSPLGAGTELLDSPVIQAIAAKHRRTAAQVVLRWHIQQGLVAIPKSSHPDRIRSNFRVFDLPLDADDFRQLATLDEGPDAGVDSDVAGH